MFPKLHTVQIILFLTFSLAHAQDTDTTETDAGGREMYTSVDISYSQDKGNTDFLSLYYGFDFTVLGDLGPLKDTEFSFNYSRSDDKLDGESFTDDQYITSKFDLWANKRFSPFLFFQKSYDNSIGLQDRLNFGTGAKVGIFKGLSISYAFLAESEDYLLYTYTDSSEAMLAGDFYYTDSSAVDPGDFENWDYYYYYDTTWYEGGDSVYYEYTDSAAYYYSDSTEAKAESFFRHSIRPKFKLKLMDGNLVFDYRFYYKPRVDDFKDYLLEHELKISIATFYELLYIDFNYTNKYNSRYDGTNIYNPDMGDFYKAVDENISIGLSFMF
tara:strand:+ start:783 stop:1763 length:981 start_codon:yes stop_codon:yes gene_type:complete